MNSGMSNAIRIGIIGGSGFAAAMSGAATGRRHEIETPFGEPSDAITEIELSGLPIYFLSRHGPGHRLGPSQVPYRANIFALKSLGVTHILASGAVGSLREEMKPRDLVIADQIIDKTRHRPGSFFDDAAAVHVEFAEPFCPVLRQILIDASDSLPKQSATHTRGCYVAMSGPAFSTRAESLLHRLWGGALIGMTAMPEAVLAREAEIAYALIAIVTDYDCWRPMPAIPGTPAQPASKATATKTSETLLDEIIGNLSAGSEHAIALVKAGIALMVNRREELAKSPALSALRLAIWSDKSQIPKEQIDRLGPLWLKYFAS